MGSGINVSAGKCHSDERSEEESPRLSLRGQCEGEISTLTGTIVAALRNDILHHHLLSGHHRFWILLEIIGQSGIFRLGFPGVNYARARQFIVPALAMVVDQYP